MWPNIWYYADADGKQLTGFQYLDNLKGGRDWYMLQVDNTNGMMQDGFRNTHTSAGRGYFSPHYGTQGACTWTYAWGSYNRATGLWEDGQIHR